MEAKVEEAHELKETEEKDIIKEREKMLFSVVFEATDGEVKQVPPKVIPDLPEKNTSKNNTARWSRVMKYFAQIINPAMYLFYVFGYFVYYIYFFEQ